MAVNGRVGVQRQRASFPGGWEAPAFAPSTRQYLPMIQCLDLLDGGTAPTGSGA